MTLYRNEIYRQTTSGTDILDLTADAQQAVAASGVTDGQLLVFVPGSTGAITTIEFESGAVNDLRRAVDDMAPEAGQYEHNLRWGDGNGYSHVRAALMGPSLTVPILDSEPLLGTWQQIILCDFDNKPRRRRILLQVTGE